ncbi:SMI1/KNR4 family protein [Streptomyces sp. NPDC015532]|uniref:SMI1/KNR4 family protein n=1 Tax=Streptomyces sp. NPDC015532 TaxID=3364960 RepID=UPI0036F64658
MELSRTYQIAELLGEPEVNGDIRRDWGSLEASYGKGLPDDYKWFVSAYGSGCVNDQLYFFHPRAVIGDQGLRIESLWEQAAYSYGELVRSSPELYPCPIYPEKSGCIPVARSVSGNYVLLMPPGSESKEWRVVVDMGSWVILDVNFTDFLYTALRGKLFVPVIEGDPFERIGEIEP